MKILKIFGCIFGIVLIMYLAVDFYIVKVYKDPVVSSLPEYCDKVFYEGGGNKGFTDYGKYYYDNDIDFSGNLNFKKVTSEDIDTIEEYFEVYKKRAADEYFYKDIDFSLNVLGESDYFVLLNCENKDGYKSYKNKLDAFDLYIYDNESRILYFMHTNI